MTNDRAHDLRRFYSILSDLEARTGGARTLANSTGRLDWPRRGVYFFFEQGEGRSDSGIGPRVVRIGTHALKLGSQTTLWTRLLQHRGQVDGGGNHRGSIFRLIVGAALINQHKYDVRSWGKQSSAPRDVRAREMFLEQTVSDFIRAMPFVWLEIDDEPGPDSLRGYIERNAIALLSNYERPAVDAPSENWLGHLCDRSRVRKSGLWNSSHVDESYHPAFLERMDALVRNVGTT